jgi:hypothetical protein
LYLNSIIVCLITFQSNKRRKFNRKNVNMFEKAKETNILRDHPWHWHIFLRENIATTCWELSFQFFQRIVIFAQQAIYSPLLGAFINTFIHCRCKTVTSNFFVHYQRTISVVAISWLKDQTEFLTFTFFHRLKITHSFNARWYSIKRFSSFDNFFCYTVS